MVPKLLPNAVKKFSQNKCLVTPACQNIFFFYLISAVLCYTFSHYLSNMLNLHLCSRNVKEVIQSIHIKLKKISG